jgi:NTE family protein
MKTTTERQQEREQLKTDISNLQHQLEEKKKALQATFTLSAASLLSDNFTDITHALETLKLEHNTIEELAEDVEHLVFEGGGIRGIAFGGSIRFMEEFNLLRNVRGIAGSSAGAIIATAVAVGFTGDEIIDVMSKTDFTTFKDDSWGIIGDLIRLVRQYGIYKGDAFYKWISDLLESKTGKGQITFKEVYERYGKVLVVTGSCLNRAQSFFFHHESYPDMPVAFAVRISMSIPLYWKAINLDGNTMVDGGVLNNFPIYAFDGKTIGDPNVDDETMNHSKTVGFKLMTSAESKSAQLYEINDRINGPMDYGKAFINALLIQVERGHIRSGYWERTVCINTHDVKTLDFALSENKKQLLVHEGYLAAKNYFTCKMCHIPNNMNACIGRGVKPRE